MIQRIQTVFLTLVVLLGVAASFLPILTFTSDGASYLMNLYKTVASEELSIVLTKNMGVGAMQGIVQLTAIATLLLFKNRSLQIKIGKLTILLIAFQIAAIVMYSDTVKSLIGKNPEDVIVDFNLGALLPVLSLICAYLAVHFIKKDDQLVRSADRLR
jgi:glucan phosphoethanolaminetransferase (alkaline phosphatase superfamily)